MAESPQPARWMVLLALGTVYSVWGSTYLAISFAVENLPPFAMTAGRFALSGSLLLALAVYQGAPRPRLLHWRSALIVGVLMMFGGTGGVTWAEQHVPSGLAALVIAAVPIWTVLLNWTVFGGSRPNGRMALGLGIGLAGVALLIGPAEILGGGENFDVVGVTALLLAALSWAIGSLYSRRAPLPDHMILTSGMEMLCGGLALALAAALTGEWGQLDLGAVSARSTLAYVYLLTVGGPAVFLAYFWLLRNTTPARATSYAYVNPVIAVILGWAVANETLSLRMIAAAVIIVGSVALITSARAQQHETPAEPAPQPAARDARHECLDADPSTAR